MERNEIIGRLSDALNAMCNLTVQDIVVDDRNSIINVYLQMGQDFQ
mgnify:CR=1 FL=1